MLTAQKPCSFADQAFRIGEEVPEKLVHPEARTRLIKNGVIAEAAGEGPLLPSSASIENIVVPILADEGDTYMSMTADDIVAAIKTVQKPEAEILADIETITSEDTLILIDVLTLGNTANDAIHEAAAARAAELTESTGEPAVNPEENPEFIELTKKRRDELVEIAEGLGIEVSDEDTKKILAAAILEKQAGSDA